MLWARQDSNLGPRDYESPALTAELQARLFAADYRISKSDQSEITGCQSAKISRLIIKSAPSFRPRRRFRLPVVIRSELITVNRGALSFWFRRSIYPGYGVYLYASEHTFILLSTADTVSIARNCCPVVQAPITTHIVQQLAELIREFGVEKVRESLAPL